MSFWHRLLRRSNGLDAELQALKDDSAEYRRKAIESARRLARSAETVSRHKKEQELAEQIARFRINEGAAE